MTSKDDLASAVSAISSQTGFINLLIANSGITGPSLDGLAKDASLAEFRNFHWNQDVNAFNQTYAVNTSAVFFTIIAFLELLDKGNKQGNVDQKSQVIATSSIGAFNRVPLAGYAYGSSKAAVVHMLK